MCIDIQELSNEFESTEPIGRPAQPSALSTFQSIPPSGPYLSRSHSLALLKCPFPKNPLIAARGLG